MEMKNKIKIDTESIIRMKLRYIGFAKSLVFLLDEFKNNGFVYISDLANFLKVTNTRAGQILKDFQRLGLVYRKQVSSLVVEWHGVKNSDNYVMEKYLPEAIKTLKKAGLWEE